MLFNKQLPMHERVASACIFSGIVVFVAATLWWVTTTSNVHGADSGFRLWYSLEVYWRFLPYVTGANGWPMLRELLLLPFTSIPSLFVEHPPFSYWLTCIFYHFFGFKLAVAKLMHLGYFFIIAGAVYGIGARFWSRLTGLLAVMLLALNPLFFQMLMQYGIDVPFTAFYVLSLYFLLLTDGFTRTSVSCVFGLVTGVGMLYKGHLLLLVAPNLFIAAAISMRQYSQDRKMRRAIFTNAICAAIIVVAVAAMWFAPRWDLTVDSFRWHQSNEIWRVATPIYGRPFFFLRECVADTGIILSIVLFASALLFFLARPPGRMFVITALLVPPVFFSFVVWLDDVRHVLPSIPFAMLLCACGIMSLRTARLRYGAMAVVLIIAFAQYMVVTFMEPTQLRAFQQAPLWGGGFRKTDWLRGKNNMQEADRVFAVLRHARHFSESKKKKILAAYLGRSGINHFELGFGLAMRDSSLHVYSIRDYHDIYSDLDRKGFDYIVMRVFPRDIENNWLRRSYLEDEINRCLNVSDAIVAEKLYQSWRGRFDALFAHKDEFNLIGRFSVEDGGEWFIYELAGQ